MRAPRQPKKPRKLTGGSRERDSGGELRQPPPRAEDYIPTAPMVPLELEDEDHGSDESYDQGQACGREESEKGDDAPLSGSEVGRRPGRLSLLTQSARAAGVELGRRLASRRSDQGDLQARRAERKREARRLRLKRLGIGAGVVALLALAGWVAFASPLLRYEYSADQIGGYAANSIVDKAELEQLVASHNGQNLLLLDADALAGDIRDIPEIATATVTKDYRHRLRIEITESVPVACLGPKDQCSAVAADGTELNVPAELAASLPRISHSDGLDPAQAISNGLGVLSTLDQGVLGQVTEVSVAKGNLVTLHLTQGRTVFWGGLERGEFKAQVLAALLTQTASYFDVSVPDAPVSR